MIPDTAMLPVLGPPTMWGMRWRHGAGLDRCWLGTFEIGKRRTLAHAVRPGAVVFDVGAHAGYYTMLFSGRAGGSGRVVAVEPLPGNLDNLRRHVSANRLRNVSVVAAAAGAEVGRSGFREESTGYMGHLADDGRLAVDVVTLDDLAGRFGLPQVMKIDVEGGEAAVLAGAARVLAEGRPTVFLATHGAPAHRESCALLTAAGYRLRSLDGRDVQDARELAAYPRLTGTGPSDRSVRSTGPGTPPRSP